MAEPQLKTTTFTCSNCGKIIIDGVWRGPHTKIRIPKFYCSYCYYKVLQANKQLITRLEHLKDGRVDNALW